MMATYYAQRASAALLVTEAVDVSTRSIGYPGTPGIYTPEMVDGWRRVVATIRAAQPAPAPVFLQLFHAGRVSHGSFRADGRPGVAPSALRAPVDLYTPVGMAPADVPEALTEEGIAATVADFVAGARAALSAGFDGVEVNGGNGYLVHQFLSDGTNHRTDRYGGSVANRLRFPLELVDALAAAVGPERVALRVSPRATTNGVDETDPGAVYTALTEALDARGLAYLHVIESAHDLELTPRIRERFAGTLVVNEGYDAGSAERAIAEGLADVVAFGRAFLANPDLPRRLAEGAPLNAADPSTFYGGAEPGYLDYPALPAD